MIIGVPKEIKNNEFRVGIVPSGVRIINGAGHQVFIQKGIPKLGLLSLPLPRKCLIMPR